MYGYKDTRIYYTGHEYEQCNNTYLDKRIHTNKINVTIINIIAAENSICI